MSYSTTFLRRHSTQGRLFAIFFAAYFKIRSNLQTFVPPAALSRLDKLFFNISKSAGTTTGAHGAHRGYTKQHDFDVKYCFEGVQINVRNVFECPKGKSMEEIQGSREATNGALMTCANAGKDLNTVELLSGGQYYFSGGLTLNWYDALKFCNARGLELVSIETEEEYEVVNTHSRSKAAGSKEKSHWMSGNDLGKPGDWYWMSTGEEMTQDEKRWHVGTLVKGNNRCASIVNKSGLFKWQPQNCNDKKSFICETPRFCLLLNQQKQLDLPKEEIAK